MPPFCSLWPFPPDQDAVETFAIESMLCLASRMECFHFNFDKGMDCMQNG
jgi:hypothetical protein